LLEDREVGIGVFPVGEEVLIGGARMCMVTLPGVGAGEAKTCRCPKGRAAHGKRDLSRSRLNAG